MTESQTAKRNTEGTKTQADTYTKWGFFSGYSPLSFASLVLNSFFFLLEILFILFNLLCIIMVSPLWFTLWSCVKSYLLQIQWFWMLWLVKKSGSGDLHPQNQAVRTFKAALKLGKYKFGLASVLQGSLSSWLHERRCVELWLRNSFFISN